MRRDVHILIRCFNEQTEAQLGGKNGGCHVVGVHEGVHESRLETGERDLEHRCGGFEREPVALSIRMQDPTDFCSTRH